MFLNKGNDLKVETKTFFEKQIRINGCFRIWIRIANADADPGETRISRIHADPEHWQKHPAKKAKNV
jgi:hypothetical protein